MSSFSVIDVFVPESEFKNHYHEGHRGNPNRGFHWLTLALAEHR
jgi:hypothetical protein